MKSLQKENKQLKLKLEESNAKVENLHALVKKQMKDMAKLGDYIKKLKKEM
jgi:peptidoglycan hydrolase CwlO-like protein